MNSEQIKFLTEENAILKEKLSKFQQLQNLEPLTDNNDSLRKLLLLINDYSMELSSVPSDMVFEYAVTRVKDFINAKSVHYTLFDKKSNELIVQHTSLKGKDRQLLKSFVGRDLVGMKFKVTEQQYKEIISDKLHVAHSINELSLGKIPQSIGLLIEKTFQVGWFLGIAMTNKDKLIGTFIIIGKRSMPIPDKEFLLAFAGITANAMIRKKAEESLISSEQRMKAYLDNSPDGIFITDYDGVIIDVNQAGADFTGFSCQYLIGLNVNKLIVELQMPEIDRLIDELTEDGNNFKVRVNYRKSDKTISTALLSCVRINKNLYASFVKNIDDIISAEEILINAKLKAEESDRLKSAFLANMSHEIRSPMNGILGFSNLLRRKELSEEKKNQFIDIINNNGNQLLVLIDDLLDIAKIEANQLKIEPRNCNLASIINEIYLQYKPKADEKKINLIIESPQDEREFDIYSDCYRIKQIITNLVTNALKFTAKGSVQILYKAENEKITIKVSDTGIGIDKAYLEKRFNRFEQIENSHLSLSSGTGLGLAITKGLVKLLDGSIDVNSESEKGSTFTICLPAFAEHQTKNSNNHQAAELIAPQNINQSKTILICEDEEANYLYLAEIMNIHNFKHIRAKNGQEAIQIVKENPDITLILMDIKMPIMDGHEASKIIKNIKPKVPIIAQTAYVLSQLKNNFMDHGFVDVITKPAAPEEIISKINACLNKC